MRGLLGYAAFSGVTAIAIGAYLVSIRGPVAVALLLAGAIFVLFYTWPLKYIGLGELAVILVWGPLMIGGTYFIVTGQWDWAVSVIGLPYALGATTVIFGKHIDKLEDDRVKGIHTLPVIVGERAARWILGAMIVLMYAMVVYLIIIGLGELAVILVWGPLMIGGTYFIVTGQWDWAVSVIGLPYALGATTVIFGKHIDKLEDDRVKGIHTLPVIVGERAARWILGAMIVLMYAMVVYLIVIGLVGPVMLVVFLGVPQARAALALYAKPRPRERPESWPAFVWPLYFVRMAFAHNRRFGLLFLVGLTVDVALRLLLPR